MQSTATPTTHVAGYAGGRLPWTQTAAEDLMRGDVFVTVANTDPNDATSEQTWQACTVKTTRRTDDGNSVLIFYMPQSGGVQTLYADAEDTFLACTLEHQPRPILH